MDNNSWRESIKYYGSLTRSIYSAMKPVLNRACSYFFLPSFSSKFLQDWIFFFFVCSKDFHINANAWSPKRIICLSLSNTHTLFLSVLLSLSLSLSLSTFIFHALMAHIALHSLFLSKTLPTFSSRHQSRIMYEERENVKQWRHCFHLKNKRRGNKPINWWSKNRTPKQRCQNEMFRVMENFGPKKER